MFMVLKDPPDRRLHGGYIVASLDGDVIATARTIDGVWSLLRAQGHRVLICEDAPSCRIVRCAHCGDLDGADFGEQIAVACGIGVQSAG